MRQKEISEIIGNNIHELMIIRDITIIELVRTLGVTRQTVNNYMFGVSALPSNMLYKMSILYDKPLDWFFEEIYDDYVWKGDGI